MTALVSQKSAHYQSLKYTCLLWGPVLTNTSTFLAKPFHSRVTLNTAVEAADVGPEPG